MSDPAVSDGDPDIASGLLHPRPRTGVDLGVVLGTIVAVTVTTGLVESFTQVAVQITGVVFVVGYALLRGYSLDTLGLARDSVAPGLRLGGVIGLAIAVGVAIIAVLPVGADFFHDDRFRDLSAASAWYEIAVRIPFVTALSEELLFRSVLLAVLLAMTSTKWAIAWSSLVFGLWHVRTTLGDLDGNEATDTLAGLEVVGAVGGVVVATGLAGVLFAWARLRSNSVVAPWLIHTSFNGSAWIAGLLLTN